MTYIKHPYTWAKKELRSLGVRCTKEDNAGATYMLEDFTGAYVSRRVTTGRAVTIVADVRKRLGLRGHIDLGDEPKPPTVVRERLRVSTHAAERFALMQRQAQIGHPELQAALFFPERVERSHDTTYIFTTSRLSAVVVFDPDSDIATVKTITWADEAMYALHPRPERESVPAATGTH